jgi:Ran GTPase-activating protein (RanGAP) involved in mRNA processing and transport
LTSLNLSSNRIEGVEGGQQVGVLLQRCPNLKYLNLCNNNLGPCGAGAMAPGLAAASNLDSLNLRNCGIENDGMAGFVPHGHVYVSLTSLDLSLNLIQGTSNWDCYCSAVQT